MILLDAKRNMAHNVISKSLNFYISKFLYF